MATKEKETAEEKKVRREKELAEHRAKLPPLWAIYDVQMDFTVELCASVPGNPNIIDAWLKARMPKTKPPMGKTITEIQEEVFETLANPTEEPPISLLVFQRIKAGAEKKPEDIGLVMRGGTIKAHLKDGSRIIAQNYMGRLEKEKSFSTKVINGLYLVEEELILRSLDDTIAQAYIPIYKQDGTRVLKADGNRDKAIHVRGPRGEQINALKNFEYILDARINFAIRVLGESIQEEDLRILFEYGSVHGYAGERGDGAGRYIFTITKREI